MSVAIVSGAARGLGKAFSDRLREEGYVVLPFDLDPSVEQQPNGLTADVSQRADVERVIDAASTLGAIEVVVNNAGTWRRTPVDSTWAQTVADWDYIMDTNILGVLLLSRAAIPHLVANGGGHIVNISTYYVLPAKSDGTNQPDTDLYNASKWALNGFTDAWAKTLYDKQVNVNGMCMGAVDTEMLRGLFPDNKLPPQLAANTIPIEEISQQLIDIIQSGRTGENFGAWVGETVSLGDKKPIYQRITG